MRFPCGFVPIEKLSYITHDYIYPPSHLYLLAKMFSNYASCPQAPTMHTEICDPLCDVMERQKLVATTKSDTTLTICVLYWGVECTHWHIININNIGFSYPTRYQDFDQCTILSGVATTDLYYLDTDVLEVPRAGEHIHKSSYILCYLNQTNHMDLLAS